MIRFARVAPTIARTKTRAAADGEPRQLMELTQIWLFLLGSCGASYVQLQTSVTHTHTHIIHTHHHAWMKGKVRGGARKTLISLAARAHKTCVDCMHIVSDWPHFAIVLIYTNVRVTRIYGCRIVRLSSHTATLYLCVRVPIRSCFLHCANIAMNGSTK